jgi:hypothetical protein
MKSLYTAGLALAWGLVASDLSAAPVAPEAKPKTVTPADKIRQALDKVVSVELDAQPFHLALNQLKDQFGVNFVLDRFTIQQMGMDPEQLQVNFKAKDVKLRTAVRSITGQFNLSFAIVGDSVLVTTDEMAMYRQMRQRVNIDLEGTEFATAIRQLARDTATNLIIDARSAKEAKGQVTLQLEDVPLETAVRLMSEMVGLKPVRVGNVMFICSKEAAKDLKTDTDLVPPTPGGPMPGGPMGIPGAPPGLILPGIGIGPGVGPGGLGGTIVVPAVPATPPVAPPAVIEKEKETPKEEIRRPEAPKPSEGR